MLRSLIKTLRRLSTLPSSIRNLSGEKKVERTRTLLRAAVAATAFAYFCTETCPYSGESNATFAILIWIIPREKKGVSSAWTPWPRRSCQGRPFLETTIIALYVIVSLPDPLVGCPYHIIWLQGSSEDGWLPFPLRRPSHWAVGCWGYCLPPHRNQEETPPKVNTWLVYSLPA